MATFPTSATDIETAASAAQAALELSTAPELAVDLEADAMHAFRARLCFVQVGTDTSIYLFDTLLPEVTVDGLAQIFANPAQTKFFHAAGGDLMFLSEVGIRVKGLFDTHRAATLLGWQKVGLADLVFERLQVKLAKEHQQSDFSLRPLPPAMREYIADDVRYLSEIGRQVREECRKADILEEVELDCQRLCDEAADRPAANAPFRVKLPRQELSKEKLAVGQALGRELHTLRLKWAEAANVPLGRMLSNAAVTAIALRPPTNMKTLARSEGVRGGFVREHGEEVLALVARLTEEAKTGVLEPEVEDKGPRDPKRRKREEALKAWRVEKATARKVTGSVVLPNPLVEQLASEPPPSLEALRVMPYFGEKRLGLYGEELLKLLAGV
jgi:ribonuclease D